MTKRSNEKQNKAHGGQATILFSDIRNFTSLTEIIEEEKVVEILDTFHGAMKKSIEKYGGCVDKIIGDAIMGVFSKGNTAIASVKTAIDMFSNLQEVNRVLSVPLQMGMGIATGKVIFVTISDLDKTVIGRKVNLGSRLESLTKEFDANLIIDEDTYQYIQQSERFNEFMKFLPIVDINIKGLYNSIDVYNVLWNLDKVERDEVSKFNEGVKHYTQKEIGPALSIFSDLYSKSKNSSLKKCEYFYLNRCLKDMEEAEELFRNAEYYHLYSNVQKEQADFLTHLINKYVDKLKININKILDIGCGTGFYTRKLANMFSDASVVGIDPSEEMIEACRRYSKNYDNIRLIKNSIEEFVDSDQDFDLIAANSTMHWVKDQKRAYSNIKDMLAADGFVAVHQGHKDCYKELRECAEKCIDKIGIRNKFVNFNYPTIYHSKESIKKLLRALDFKVFEVQVLNTVETDTLVEDFIAAGLRPYCEVLLPVEENIFVKEFRKEANNLDSITTNRLYFVAGHRRN